MRVGLDNPEAGSLLEQAHQLYREARGIPAQAKTDGDGRLALLAVAASGPGAGA